MRTLIVEDDPATRRLLGEVLRSRLHEVTLCADGRGAMEAFERDGPSLVVLNWRLAAEHSLVPAIRSRPGGEHVVLFAVTENAASANPEAALREGANDYIPKPVDPRLLDWRLTLAERQSGELRDRRRELTRAEDALRANELRTRLIVETAHDAFVAIDAASTIIDWNRQAERMFGWSREEALGRPLADTIIPPRYRKAYLDGLERFQRSGRGHLMGRRIELMALRRDGGEFPVELSVRPIRSGGTSFFASFIRDITERVRAESVRSAQLSVTRLLAEATSMDGAVRGLLRVICDNLGWSVGTYWDVDESGTRLRCRVLHAGTGEAADFEETTRGMSCARGAVLPGHVWESGAPRWIEDVAAEPSFLRGGIAVAAGLRCACGFPVASGSGFVGVIELFGRRVAAPDTGLLEMMSDLGQRLAQFHRRTLAEAAHRESEERYSLAVRGANDGVWDWDLRKGTLYVSPRWKRMVGHDEGEIGDDKSEWFDRVHPEDLPRLQEKLAAHLEGKSPQFEHEYRMRHRDGTYRWVLTRGIAVRGADGTPHRMAGSQTDVTDRRAYDPLTILPNRALFLDRLELALARARRHPEYRFAVLFLDLDRFKLVNDTLGHLVGDELLVALARRMEECLRPGDTIARFGGDEFAILLDRIADAADAALVAERIQRKVCLPFGLSGHKVRSSASIGIATSLPRYRQPEDMLRDADAALYRAKASGGACHVPFDERMLARGRLEGELKEALVQGELRMVYQPVLSLKDGRLLALEALVRWRHPERGDLLPSDFLPLAEEGGLIAAVDRWALAAVCRQLREWRALFPGDPFPMVTANLSVRPLAAPGAADACEEIVRSSGIAPESLGVEVKAGLLDGGSANAALGRLRSLGVRILLDDFGAGSSSLAVLHRIDGVKVDRSLVAGIPSDPDCVSVLRMITGLGHSLSLGVVAKGIETESQRSELLSIGCAEGQGALLSEPLEAETAAALIARWAV